MNAPIDFADKNGPRADAMHAVNYFVNCWISNPTLEKQEVFEQYYTQLLEERPKDAKELNSIPGHQFYILHRTDLEKQLIEFTHVDRTERVQADQCPFPGDAFPTTLLGVDRDEIKHVNEEYDGPFQEKLKEYFNCTRHEYNIIHNKKTCPDGLHALKQVLST